MNFVENILTFNMKTFNDPIEIFLYFVISKKISLLKLKLKLKIKPKTE